MNAAVKWGITQGTPQAKFCQLRAAFFHSTPILERRRRNQWESRYSNHQKRYKKQQWRRFVLREVNSYAEELFKSWRGDFDEGGFSNRGPSWFRGDSGTNGSKESRSRSRSNGPQFRGRQKPFDFCEDDPEVETIFENAFGNGYRYFTWSFVNEDDPRFGCSSGFRNRRQSSRKWRYHSEEEDDSSTTQESSRSGFVSDRLALGLSATGPLKLDDVKTAYRTCALKWHPDRHMGESKTVAEEKFKVCTAAYQSLCDRLAVN